MVEVRRIERECPREVREPTSGKRLRFEQGRHRNAVRAVRDLPASQFEAFVSLDVGTQVNAKPARAAGHMRQIALHHIAVEQERRRLNVQHLGRDGHVRESG